MKVTKNRKEALIQKRLFPSRKTPYRSELDMIEESLDQEWGMKGIASRSEAKQSK